jgi:hypothetical protein
VPSHEVAFRRETHADVPNLVRMLADEVLSAKRERYTLPLPQRDDSAFEAIDTAPTMTWWWQSLTARGWV